MQTKDVGDETARKDVYRKRKGYKLSPSGKVTWETTMTGTQEDHISSFSAYGQEQLPFISIVVEWMVAGGPLNDESICSSHKYESSLALTVHCSTYSNKLVFIFY